MSEFLQSRNYLGRSSFGYFFHVRLRHTAESHYPCFSKVILCSVINSLLAEHNIGASLQDSISYLAQKLFFCIQKTLELLRTRYRYSGFPLRAPYFQGNINKGNSCFFNIFRHVCMSYLFINYNSFNKLAFFCAFANNFDNIYVVQVNFPPVSNFVYGFNNDFSKLVFMPLCALASHSSNSNFLQRFLAVCLLGYFFGKQ